MGNFSLNKSCFCVAYPQHILTYPNTYQCTWTTPLVFQQCFMAFCKLQIVDICDVFNSIELYSL